MHSTRAIPGRNAVFALAIAVAAPGAELAAQAAADHHALVAPVRAGVSYLPAAADAPRAPLTVAPGAIDVHARQGSAERSVLRGTVIGALVGAAGGVAMGAFVCNQGFGCSDRGPVITYWTLAGAGAGAVTGWVLHVVRSED